MLRGRVASSLPRGVCPLDSTPRPRGGVLPQALRALFLGGAAPGAPLFLLVRSNQKPPTPLLYYLSEGRRSLPSHETRANRRR